MTWVALLKILAVGLAAGYLSGQFGIGGGIITTPAIRLILHRTAAIAIGTPLVVIIPSALTGAFNYARQGYVDRNLIGPLAASGLLGVLAGSALTAYVSPHLIMLFTAVIIFFVGIKFFFSRTAGEKERAEKHRLKSSINRRWQDKKLTGALLAGLAAGLFSGFLGLGGGLLLTPVLVYFFDSEIKQAFGTSLACVSIYALPGSFIHFLLDHVDLKLALVLTVGTIPGAFLGSKVALRAADRTLRILFGLFLIILSIYFGLSEMIGWAGLSFP